VDSYIANFGMYLSYLLNFLTKFWMLILASW